MDYSTFTDDDLNRECTGNLWKSVRAIDNDHPDVERAQKFARLADDVRNEMIRRANQRIAEMNTPMNHDEMLRRLEEDR